jgi:hypothetical protein
MCGDGFLHLIGARFEYLEQIAMTILEVFQNLREFTGSRAGIERQDAIDDVIGARLVGRIEVPRFGRRLERPDDHSCRIRAQIEALPIQ